MTGSPSAMPGAFSSYAPRDHGAPPRLSGAKSHIFQPPCTPSASSSVILTRSTASVMSLSSAGDRPARPTLRKRGREEYDGGVETARYNSGVETPRMDIDDGDYLMDVESPHPFVNTKYQLVGGLDTPGLAAQLAIEARDEVDMNGYRKCLGGNLDRPSGRSMFGEQDYFHQDDSFRESSGGIQSGFGLTPRTEGWSRAAIQVASIVMGKAWEFCRNSAAVFTGFKAGGGTGYNANKDASHFEALITDEENIWEDRSGHQLPDRTSTPLAAQYPTNSLEFVPDWMDEPTPEPTPQRPPKRRQVSANNVGDGLEKNWVVVPPPAPKVTPTRPPVQAKPPPRYSLPTSASGGRRNVATTAPQRPASRACFGTNASPAPRRNGVSRVSHAGSPALNPAQRASFASPRSPSSASKISRNSIPGSPLRKSNESVVTESPAALEAKREAQRWAAIRKKEEKEQDESIRRLDAQLKAMIREGKEALGTKVSIEEDNRKPPVSPKKGSGTPVGGVKKWSF